MSDPLGSIQLKEEDSTGKALLNAVPVLGNGVKAFEAAAAADQDGSRSLTEQSGVTAEATGFVQSCMDVAGVVSDPIGWLVGQGLNFLLAVCAPLQDAIHFVSGDGPALAAAAESFNNIGRGLEQFAQQFADEATASLAQWEGEASQTAGEKLGEFAGGIRGTAGKAGDIAGLLQISSMVMTVVEDFIKALLTELITWLIMIWIPALAAAIPSFGASTAAAGAATGVRAGMTATRATRQVSKLQKLLDMIKTLIEKLKLVLNKTKDVIAKMKNSGIAGMADRRNAGFGKSMLDAATGEAKAQVGMPGQPGDAPRPGKPVGHAENARKAGEYAATGDDQSVQETSEKLDF